MTLATTEDTADTAVQPGWRSRFVLRSTVSSVVES